MRNLTLHNMLAMDFPRENYVQISLTKKLTLEEFKRLVEIIEFAAFSFIEESPPTPTDPGTATEEGEK